MVRTESVDLEGVHPWHGEIPLEHAERFDGNPDRPREARSSLGLLLVAVDGAG
jgi:hypothetical protein